MRRIQIAALCLGTLIGVAGCSGNNDVFSVPAQTAEQAAQSATQEITAPAIEGLNLFGLGEIFGGPSPAVVGGPSPGIGKGEECDDYSEVCTSGSAELCYTEAGDVLDFDQCRASEDGKMYDGTLSLSEGTATYSLTIDGTRMSGIIAWYYSDKACITESLLGFSVTGGSSTSVVSGELEYCDGEDWPFGSSIFTIDNTWRIDMTLDGTNSAEATVTNLNTDVAASCTIDLDSSEVICGT